MIKNYCPLRIFHVAVSVDVIPQAAVQTVAELISNFRGV